MKIAIVGISGDLGSQLAENIKHAGHDCIGFRSKHAQDPRLFTQNLENCQIIHWCAPLAALASLENILPNSLLILHDSVMDSSQKAAKQLKCRIPHAQIAIVHCLMNPEKTVAIADNSANLAGIQKHLSHIGLSPQIIDLAKHDELMAHSQAPLALLCQVLLPILEENQPKGLLTQSAVDLLQTLKHHNLRWTDSTRQSVLGNPKLQILANSIQEIINNQQK